MAGVHASPLIIFPIFIYLQLGMLPLPFMLSDPGGHSPTLRAVIIE